MKGFFIIYYDDIRGPILEDRLIYLLNLDTIVNEDLARQIFYSLNLQQESTQNFMKFFSGSDEICTFFTSRVRRDDIPVIFNVILDPDESREKYFGFIQKWTKYIYNKMLEGKGFTINPVINDVERRIETVDFQHARFKFLAGKKHWELLEGCIKKGTGQPSDLKTMQVFGLLNQEGRLKRKEFNNLVDFILQKDFSQIPPNIPEAIRLSLTTQIKLKLENILGIYRKAKNFRELHFLGQNFPYSFFSLFEDAIAYRIFQFFENHTYATSKEVARAIGIDLAQVNDYLDFLGKNSPMLSLVKDGEDYYVYKVLSLELSIPYDEDPSQIEIKNQDLHRDTTIIQFPNEKRKKQGKEKRKKRPVPVITTTVMENTPVPVSPQPPAAMSTTVSIVPKEKASTTSASIDEKQTAQATEQFIKSEPDAFQEITLTPDELKMVGQVFAQYF